MYLINDNGNQLPTGSRPVGLRKPLEPIVD